MISVDPDLTSDAGHRFALLIAMTQFADDSLVDLASSTRDVQDLADVLADPDIGNCQVTTLLDCGTQDLMIAVDRFFGERTPADMALLFLSTHGLLDSRGRLYFATPDTRREFIASTALSSDFIRERMDDCRSRQQVMLLDCAFSGAFMRYK